MTQLPSSPLESARVIYLEYKTHCATLEYTRCHIPGHICMFQNFLCEKISVVLKYIEHPVLFSKVVRSIIFGMVFYSETRCCI